MESENNLLSGDNLQKTPHFVFGILINPDGKNFAVQSQMHNIPIELVIMQLRAFLRNLETEYFDNFDKNTIKKRDGPPS